MAKDNNHNPEAVEHAFVMCHDTEIGVDHLPPYISAQVTHGRSPKSHRRNEKEIIVEALRRYNGNRVQVAT